MIGFQYANGSFGAEAAEHVSSLLDLGKKIRADGQHNGKPVIGGCVLSSSRPMPVMQFKCAPAVAKATKVKADK
jgi:hypothetical protein